MRETGGGRGENRGWRGATSDGMPGERGGELGRQGSETLFKETFGERM